MLQTVNPATGEPGRSYPENTVDDARAAAAAAHAAFEAWRRTAFAKRAAMMREAGAILRRRKDEFAALMTDEMGKTLTEGRAEIEKCATQCDWFAEHAEGYLAPEPVDIGGPRGFRHLQPAGRRPRGDAVEFPLLAGVPLRRPGADGRQRRAPETRQQRARLRAGDRGRCSTRRAFPRTCSAHCCCRAAR